MNRYIKIALAASASLFCLFYAIQNMANLGAAEWFVGTMTAMLSSTTFAFTAFAFATLALFGSFGTSGSFVTTTLALATFTFLRGFGFVTTALTLTAFAFIGSLFTVAATLTLATFTLAFLAIIGKIITRLQLVGGK